LNLLKISGFIVYFCASDQTSTKPYLGLLIVVLLLLLLM